MSDSKPSSKDRGLAGLTDKKQTIKQLNQKSRNLAILYQTNKIINSTLDLDEILKNLVSIVIQKLSYDEFSILFLKGDRLVLKKSFKHPKRNVKKYHIKLGEGITGTVAKTGIPELVNDVLKDKRYLAIRGGIRSELAAPIWDKDKVIGVFNVESKKANAFDESDLFLISALADQASVAISNARMTKSLRKSNQRLESINEIGRIINSSLDLDTIFKKFLKYASRELNYDFCAILMIEKGRLYTRAGIGFTTKELDTYSADIGEGICGVVAKDGKPIMCNDVSKLSFYKDQAPLTKSEMAVPLKVEDKVIGVFNVESKEVDAFDKDDLLFLSALSDQTAIAIRNAQLYGRIKNFNVELKRKVEEATKELREANKELERLNQIKSDFVSIVSHELRTPLTSIHGYVSLICDGDAGPVSPEQKEFLTIVNEEGERLTRLISDLLDISKIEEGRMRLVFNRFSMKAFMEDYEKEIKGMAMPKKIKVEVSVPKLPVIKADTDKVKQIFNNLVGNAIKFSGKGTTLKVVVKDKPKHIQIDVIDQGPGIAEKDQELIFGKFHQVDSKMTRKVGGTGLGLAITRHLIEAHGGKIWVKSKIGEGSTFSFTVSKGLK